MTDSPAPYRYETLRIAQQGPVDWLTLDRPAALNALTATLLWELNDYFGGGFALALAADVRIAGESTRMNAAFLRVGLSGCDVGSSYFLPRLAGVSLASELLLTGRFIDARRCLERGLVSEVVPDDRLEQAALPYLREMLQASPLGLRLTKECLNQSIDAGSLEAAVNMEDRNQILCAQSGAMGEAVAAFFAHRPPAWSVEPVPPADRPRE